MKTENHHLFTILLSQRHAAVTEKAVPDGSRGVYGMKGWGNDGAGLSKGWVWRCDNNTQCQGTRQYQRRGVSRDLWSCLPQGRAGGIFQSKRYFEHLSQRNACLRFLEALQQVMPVAPSNLQEAPASAPVLQAATREDNQAAEPEEQPLCAP